MASSCSAVVPMAAVMPLTHKVTLNTTNNFLFNPLTSRINNNNTRVVAASKKSSSLVVKSSLKVNNNVATAIAAAALTASMVVPEVAQAASGVTPSLNNFLLSIGAGGAVLGAILGAIIGVSNFDPVKRG